MPFSIFFFSADGATDTPDKYQSLFAHAKFADRNGFSAIWTPERHFQQFGGLYPNPSVLAAALAMVTERIQIRAGSVALPLHHPVRVAEEWSVVDNLSGGRVAISFASGWHPHDFVLSPVAYGERKEYTFRHIQTIRDLWSGRKNRFAAKDGAEYDLAILPRPIQRELPVWVTISGNPATWKRTGEIGANVLTMLGNQTLEELSAKISVYKAALARNGYAAADKTISVMLHTFLGASDDAVKRLIRVPMLNYLKSYIGQHESIPDQESRFAVRGALSESDREALAERAFDRYFESSSLMGTPEKCAKLVERLAGIGVSEVACLIDFGMDGAESARSLEHLADFRMQFDRGDGH